MSTVFLLEFVISNENQVIHQCAALLRKAKRGYALKLHVIINHKGEIVSFTISPGNVADNNTDIIYAITKGLFSKMFGNKGYLLRKEVREKLAENNLSIFTKGKKRWP